MSEDRIVSVGRWMIFLALGIFGLLAECSAALATEIPDPATAAKDLAGMNSAQALAYAVVVLSIGLVACVLYIASLLTGVIKANTAALEHCDGHRARKRLLQQAGGIES